MKRNGLAPGLVVAQRYHVERLLGGGGSGRVYLCWDSAGRRRLALKMLAAKEPSAAEIHGLRQEFSLLSRIKHPSLVRILDFGILENRLIPYLVEEYVNGKSILDFTAKQDRTQRIRLLVDLCRTLQYLHWRGIVHGDLKPSNLMVAEPEGDLKILDFGLARLAFAGETERSIGTLGYAAPELLMGRCADIRSDLYSLGVVSYQILARRLPFEEEDPGFLVQKQVQGFTDIRPLDGPRGAELTQVVRTLLDKDPEKRPQSAEEVVRLFGAATGCDFSSVPARWAESYFSAGRFVGRDTEMKTLQTRASQVRESSRGFTIFLEGESGAGKTRCMEEFRTWALLAGWSVVEGQCTRNDSRSYGPFRQILDATNSQETSKSGAALEDLPRIGESALEPGSDTAAGQFRDQLTRTMVRRLNNRPTVVFLHDFHWADEATRTVLDYLISDIANHPILLVVSLRVGEAKLPLDRLIQQTARQARGEEVSLSGLSLDAVIALIDSLTGDLGRTMGEWIYRSSGGNPFFVEEILKHLVDRGLLRREQAKWRLQQDGIAKLEVPGNVAVILRHRLKELSTQARELSGWLALFSKGASQEELHALSGTLRIAQALAELTSRQIVRSLGGEGGRIEFCHALISEVIIEDLPAAGCRKMHRRIAEMLEEQEANSTRVQELAVHWIEAGDVGKAMPYALKAAAECRSEYANDAALRFYEYILGRRGSLSPEDLVSIAMEAAEAYCAVGAPKRALKVLKKEIGSPTVKAMPLQQARLCVQLSRAYQFLGDLHLSKKTALCGLDLIGNAAQSEVFLKSQLLGQLAFCTLNKGHISEGLELVDTALALSSIAPSHLHAGRLFTLKAGLCWALGKYREGVQAANRSVQLLEELSATSILPIAYAHLGMNLSALGKLGKGIDCIQTAVKIGDCSRSPYLQAQALCNLAEWYCRSGNLADAQMTNESLRTVTSKISNKMIEYSTLLCSLEVQNATGDSLNARDTLTTILKSNVSIIPTHAKAQAHYQAAYLYQSIGAYNDALIEIKKCLQLKPANLWTFETALSEILRADIMCQQQRNSDAIEILQAVENDWRKQHLSYHRAHASLILSRAFLSLGHIQKAKKSALEVLKLSLAMPSINLQSKAHEVMGQISFRQLSFLSPGSHQNEIIDTARFHFQEAIQLAEKVKLHTVMSYAHVGLALLDEVTGQYSSGLQHVQQAKDFSRPAGDQRTGAPGLITHYMIEKECREILKRLQDKVDYPELAIHRLQEEHLRLLTRASVIISKHRDLNIILETTVDMLVQSIGMERALVFLTEPESGKLMLAKGRNIRQETLERAEALSTSIIQDAHLRERPFITANARTDPRSSVKDSVISYQLGSILCAPLRAAGRTIGVLYADHPEPMANLSESSINLFAAFCNLVAVAVDNAQANAKLLQEKSELEKHLREAREGFPEIIGQSPAIQSLRQRIQQTAASPLDVLIVGESGTGKELVAEAIHRTGRRASGPFVAVDCGSLSDSLFESELFGYRKGAFTGATENRSGLLESANGGVLFLDEISNVPMPLQAKFLRVLQQREFRRIGETTIRKLDVQVVAATNKKLRNEIRRGKFRDDLYYRLKSIEIPVPPLRERREDIQLLIDWYLAKTAQVEGGRAKRFSPEALELLLNDPFPGNVRELKSSVQSAYYLALGKIIQVENIPEDIRVRAKACADADLEKVGGMEIYRRIQKGSGSFEQLVKVPFTERRFGTKVVKEVIERALSDAGGKYRDAFRLLRVPDEQYPVVMLFLKRKKCYVDYRPFRRKSGNRGKKPDEE